MPLFGSKHKHDKEPAATSGLHTMGPASANHHDHTNTQVLKGDYGVPTAAWLKLLAMIMPHGYAGDGTGLDSATGAHGTHGGETSPTPPPATTSSGGGATGTRMTGKIESAIGSAFNSESMKIKGLEKQREADLINKQGSELAQAEASNAKLSCIVSAQRVWLLMVSNLLLIVLDDKFAQRIGGPLDSNNLHHGDRQPY
ncbi:hypothetical protein BKA70DRAFT_1415812 [Coprinopsis sp. MPI-PUGE-AT-0042]|nr:hypothetical protein BKA70DRAFT_1415812 [Coprinopsis sp. MPI-PUGE-AT-0042]